VWAKKGRKWKYDKESGTGVYKDRPNQSVDQPVEEWRQFSEDLAAFDNSVTRPNFI
jgi:hypothetical protein